jgi:hypothetical protein
MTIDEKILEKLNLSLTENEIKSSIEDLTKNGYDKNELLKIYYSLQKINLGTPNLSEHYKNSLILNVNAKIKSKKEISRLNRYSFALYTSLAILLVLFIYNNFSYVQHNENLIKFSKSDIEILTQINSKDLEKTSLYSDYIIPDKEMKNNIKSEKSEVADEELVAIAETNTQIISDNYIPGVDDALLYECADEEMLNSIFKNL